MDFFHWVDCSRTFYFDWKYHFYSIIFFFFFVHEPPAVDNKSSFVIFHALTQIHVKVPTWRNRVNHAAAVARGCDFRWPRDGRIWRNAKTTRGMHEQRAQNCMVLSAHLPQRRNTQPWRRHRFTVNEWTINTREHWLARESRLVIRRIVFYAPQHTRHLTSEAHGDDS